MLILRPHHKPTELEFLGLGSGTCLFKVSSPSGSNSDARWQLRTTTQHLLSSLVCVKGSPQHVTMTGTSKPLAFLSWSGTTLNAWMSSWAHRRQPSAGVPLHLGPPVQVPPFNFLVYLLIKSVQIESILWCAFYPWCITWYLVCGDHSVFIEWIELSGATCWSMMLWGREARF